LKILWYSCLLLRMGSDCTKALRGDEMTRLGFTLVCVAGVVFFGGAATAKEYSIGADERRDGDWRGLSAANRNGSARRDASGS
jgi:hypothetical protein